VSSWTLDLAKLKSTQRTADLLSWFPKLWRCHQRRWCGVFRIWREQSRLSSNFSMLYTYLIQTRLRIGYTYTSEGHVISCMRQLSGQIVTKRWCNN